MNPGFPGVQLALSAASQGLRQRHREAGARTARARLGIQALGCGVLLDHMLAYGQGFLQNL